jgi:hypothetical protein
VTTGAAIIMVSTMVESIIVASGGVDTAAGSVEDDLNGHPVLA